MCLLESRRSGGGAVRLVDQVPTALCAPPESMCRSTPLCGPTVWEKSESRMKFLTHRVLAVSLNWQNARRNVSYGFAPFLGMGFSRRVGPGFSWVGGARRFSPIRREATACTLSRFVRVGLGFPGWVVSGDENSPSPWKNTGLKHSASRARPVVAALCYALNTAINTVQLLVAPPQCVGVGRLLRLARGLWSLV